MAKLIAQFDEFLSEIEPSGKAVRYASKAHTRIRDHLEKDETFKQNLRDSFLYGSYKRSTAVCEIKDVDIVLLTNFDPDEKENTPSNVLKRVKEALNRYYKDSENQQYQRRSIRVDDPLPEEKNSNLTLDIIPAFAPNGDDRILLVPDRDLKTWVQSHPKGHIKYTSELNSKDQSNGMFVPFVKIMKYWWKYQCEIRQPKVKRPKPKGFWIECLAGENFDKKQETYTLHFIKVLENISNKYSKATKVPELEDPGLKNGKIIKTSMTLNEFKIFINTINECLKLAISAYREEDDEKSAQIWKKIFGGKFPIPQKAKSNESLSQIFTKGFSLGDFSHRQNPIEANIIDRGSYKIPVSIEADLYWGRPKDKIMNRRFQKRFSSMSELPIYHWLKYEVLGNIPDRYEIYWQVVNTGAHARSVIGGLRGEIFRGGRIQWERSLYTGVHWIECYIVEPSSRLCVGKGGPYYVVFNNPEFPFRK